MKLSLVPFLVLSVFHLMGLAVEEETLRMLTKPLLIPALSWHYWQQTATPDRGLLIALFFSFLGDVFLLKSTSLFFLLGLGSFLAAQILYTLKMGERILKIRKDLLVAAFPLLGYASVLLYLLLPKLGMLMPAVLIYTFAICCFGILSITYWVQNPKKGQPIVAGSLLFVLSDSMLALNQFYFGSDFFGPGVMTTYLGAQYFIVTFFTRESIAE